MQKLILSSCFISILFIVSCKHESPDSVQENNDIKMEQSLHDEAIIKNKINFLPIKNIDTVCFEEIFFTGKDRNRFYAKLFISNNSVSGYLEHQFHNVPIIFGQLEGKKTKNSIVAQYNYFLDGSTNSQIVEFLISDNFIIQKTGELEEKNGIQFLNEKTAIFTDTFLRISCSNNPIQI